MTRGLAGLFPGWDDVSEFRDDRRSGLSVLLFISDKSLQSARSAAELADRLAPTPLASLFPRRVYTGRYAPRAAMRRRAGL